MDAYFALKKAFYTLEMKQAKDIFVMFNSSCIRITYYLYVIVVTGGHSSHLLPLFPSEGSYPRCCSINSLNLLGIKRY